jgi:predicted nucleic acid-binding Zn ribbon protein
MIIMPSDEKPISELIDRMLDIYRLKSGVDEKRLEESWEEIMGKTIARHTRKVVLKDGVLLLEINSAPLKQELNLSKPKIIQLINEKLGKDTVKDVRVF